MANAVISSQQSQIVAAAEPSAGHTVTIAGLALVPIAARMGQSGSEIQAPMAIVILCGLVTSALLNMVVVPTLYLRFGRASAGAQRAA